MELALIPHDYLINTIKENEDKTVKESIFLIKAIKIKNTSKNKIILKKLTFKLKASGMVKQKLSYMPEVISERAEQLKNILAFIGVKQEDKIKEVARKANALLFMGQESFWNFNDFTSNNELEPGEETGFRLEVFRIVTPEPIDELIMKVKYEEKEKTYKTTITIPVKIFENKNDYIFPVKGAWLVYGNWDHTYNHRAMFSQEFAIDLVQYNHDLTFPQTKETPNEQFKCYGEDILAIADGKVVASLDGTPENPSSLKMLPNEKRRDLVEKYGFEVVASGNYVIIEHSGGEYSFYAHMKTGSIKISQGDEVKQGQVIGQVGNSGNSTGPHLHFHLMDSPSVLTGRGLPCAFTNITDVTGETITTIQDNLMVVHTNNENEKKK